MDENLKGIDNNGNAGQSLRAYHAPKLVTLGPIQSLVQSGAVGGGDGDNGSDGVAS
jgi:hypothetical protein